MKSFIPSFPEMPKIESIYSSLKRRYKKKIHKVNLKCLHLKTSEYRASMCDTPENLEKCLYKPRVDLPLFPLSFPVSWDADPYEDRNWCLHLNSLRILDRFFYNYEKNSDKRYLNFPLRIIKDWYSFHFDNGFIMKKHFFVYDDMTCGIRQLRVAYLVDKYMSGDIDLEEDNLEYLSHLLYHHWSILSDLKNFKSTNHTISLLHALMSLIVILEFDDELRQRWFLSLLHCFDYLIRSQFDHRGVHVENSPEYHFFVLKLFDELTASGWYEAANRESRDMLALAHKIGEWLRLPDGRIIPIGDSNARPPINKKGNHLLEISRNYVCNKITSFIHPLYSIIKNVESESKYSFLAVKSGHVIQTHRHRDDLSYIWSESGCDLIVDPGKYAYTKDVYRSYVKSANAHNTIVFPGKVEGDFVPNALAPDFCETSYGVRINFLKRINNGSAINRIIYFSPGAWLVIEDNISNLRNDMGFTSFIHFSPEISWINSEDCSLKGKLGISNRGELHVSCFANQEIKVKKSPGGDLYPEINGFVSRGYKAVESAPYMAVRGVGNAKLVIGFSLIGDFEINCANGGLGLVFGETREILLC